MKFSPKRCLGDLSVVISKVQKSTDSKELAKWSERPIDNFSQIAKQRIFRDLNDSSFDRFVLISPMEIPRFSHWYF